MELQSYGWLYNETRPPLYYILFILSRFVQLCFLYVSYFWSLRCVWHCDLSESSSNMLCVCVMVKTTSLSDKKLVCVCLSGECKQLKWVQLMFIPICSKSQQKVILMFYCFLNYSNVKKEMFTSVFWYFLLVRLIY